jgi:hypothetical protein
MKVCDHGLAASLLRTDHATWYAVAKSGRPGFGRPVHSVYPRGPVAKMIALVDIGPVVIVWNAAYASRPNATEQDDDPN